MLVALALLLAQTGFSAAEKDCDYNLEAMLALDQQAFDQDFQGGWRTLSNRGCYIEAAELIREWRYIKRTHSTVLYTHEAQMRAFAGQTGQAIDLFRLTYKSQDFDAEFGWNYYMDGTIAFLERDRAGLTQAIERLEVVPMPADLIDEDNGQRKMAWPPNLSVLQAFERCWDKNYAEAYGSPQCYDPAHAGGD